MGDNDDEGAGSWEREEEEEEEEEDDIELEEATRSPPRVHEEAKEGSRRSAGSSIASVRQEARKAGAGKKVSERSAWPRFCQNARGCTALPLYGEYWDRIPRFCLEHRHDHHINVRSACRYKYMGQAPNGTRVIDVRNIPVVENPADPDDAERLRKCFEPYHDCELCGAKGWVDWYYDFPFLVKRLCIRDILDYVSTEHTGRPCMSPPPEYLNQTLDGVPLGPHATTGDEEWKRFEGTQEGSDVRTNKDVRDTEHLQALIDRERAIAAGETAEQRTAYVRSICSRQVLVLAPCCHGAVLVFQLELLVVVKC